MYEYFGKPSAFIAMALFALMDGSKYGFPFVFSDLAHAECQNLQISVMKPKFCHSTSFITVISSCILHSHTTEDSP